jgi:hypothetical protein
VPDCDSADPAALFDAVLVRPSRNTLEAAVAAFGDVTFLFPVWESALPAAVFDAAPVEGLFSTFDAAAAAFGLVAFVAIFNLQSDVRLGKWKVQGDSALWQLLRLRLTTLIVY